MIKILIPLDGSSIAERAIYHAHAISKAFPAELVLLRVVADTDSSGTVRKDCVDFALWRRQAQAYLDGLAKDFSSEELTIRGEVAEGSPAATIVKYAKRTEPDLLVLSRYGRGNAREFAVGGTAQKIVTSVNCSILLLDPAKTVEPDKTYRRILVPIYDGRECDGVVGIAAMIAEIHGSSLMLLHVSDEPQLPRGLPPTRHSRQLVNEMHRIIRHAAQQRLQVLAAGMPGNIKVEKRILISMDPSLAIESTADDYNCDLLLLHSTNSGADLERRHNAVNQSLVQYSHNPLFILQSSGLEGFASNFRSVYLDRQSMEAS
jgi:nucleotide-binding universal stress UspA family protein